MTERFPESPGCNPSPRTDELRLGRLWIFSASHPNFSTATDAPRLFGRGMSGRVKNLSTTGQTPVLISVSKLHREVWRGYHNTEGVETNSHLM